MLTMTDSQMMVVSHTGVRLGKGAGKHEEQSRAAGPLLTVSVMDEAHGSPGPKASKQAAEASTHLVVFLILCLSVKHPFLFC